MSAFYQLLDELETDAAESESAGKEWRVVLVRELHASLEAALDEHWSELRRLRDKARHKAHNNGGGFCEHCGADYGDPAGAYETCARLLGRELPEWSPQEKGSK